MSNTADTTDALPVSLRDQMTPREAYCKIALFEKAPYIPNLETIDSKNLARWRRQGMPADADYYEYFELDQKPFVWRGLEYGPLPGVANYNQDLPDMGPDYDVGRDRWGRVGAWHKHSQDDPDEDWAEGAYIVVEGALQNREEWEEIRDHFQPDIDKRYPADWPELVKKWRETTDRALILEAPSMVGSLRMELDFENYCMQLYDDPAMIEELMERRTQLALQIMGPALDEMGFDAIWFWEDCCYRGGPILSPEMFEKLAVPRYKRISDWYKTRGGKIVAMDSDGDINLLVPGWIKGGINHIWPLERFAGVDPVALRDHYGQDFSIRGGVDKFAPAKGKDAVDRELDHIFPVLQDGGFLPHLDHRLPDTPFENYCYYMEQKKKMLEAV